DYRLMYSAYRELSVKATSYYMYSLDKDFAEADPFLNGISLPYVIKGTLRQRGYQFTVTPGYETLFMDAQKTGSRDNILNSIYGSGDFTVIMRDNWFASYTFEVRNDSFDLASQTGDNDLSSMKYTLKT